MTSVVAQAQNSVEFLIPLLVMVAIFYFLLIRPQQRRVKQQRQLLESLQVGDEVVTIGGLFGTILEMDDESVTLDAGGSRLRFLRQAVARKFVEETEEQVDET